MAKGFEPGFDGAAGGENVKSGKLEFDLGGVMSTQKEGDSTSRAARRSMEVARKFAVFAVEPRSAPTPSAG